MHVIPRHGALPRGLAGELELEDPVRLRLARAEELDVVVAVRLGGAREGAHALDRRERARTEEADQRDEDRAARPAVGVGAEGSLELGGDGGAEAAGRVA